MMLLMPLERDPNETDGHILDQALFWAEFVKQIGDLRVPALQRKLQATISPWFCTRTETMVCSFLNLRSFT